MRHYLKSPVYDVEDKKRAVNYHIDIMLNRSLTMFRYAGLPDSLPEVELEMILQTMGKAIVTKIGGDLVALWGNWGAKKNTYYKPISMIVANPWADDGRGVNQEFFFDNDCILIKNDPLCRGLLPIYEKYGAFEAESDITFRNALVLFRAMLNLIAPDDRAKASADQYLENLLKGKLSTMLDDDWMTENRIQNSSLASSIQGYITQIIEAKQYLKGSELNDLGLQANYNMKRERLSEAETTLNDDSLRPLIDSMLEERKQAVAKINEMFGTDITVEFDSSWEKWNPGEDTEGGPEDEGFAGDIEEDPEGVEDSEDSSTDALSDPVDDPVDTDLPADESDTGDGVTPIIEEVAEVIEEIIEEVKEDIEKEVTADETSEP